MNENIAEGNWKEIKGKVKEQWGELTNDEIDKTEGNIDQIVGKIQAKYGSNSDDIRKNVNSFLEKINQSLSADKN